MRAARPVSCWQWKSCCGANRASRSAHRLIREVRPCADDTPLAEGASPAAAAAARPKGGILLPVLIGIGLAVAVIVLIDAALRPTVTELAKAKVKNAVTSIINDAVNETLSSEAISYGDLVTLEKDTAGQVTVLAANTAQLNALRTEILGRILEQVEQLDSQELGIPLGNLTGFATASDLGPVLPVRVLTAATPTAAFEHVFTSSGTTRPFIRSAECSGRVYPADPRRHGGHGRGGTSVCG